MQDYLALVLTDNNLPQTGSTGVSEPPDPDFTGTPLSGTDPLTVDFTSLGSSPYHLWLKGINGVYVLFSVSQRNLADPSEEFTEGVWDIRHIVMNAAGHTEEIKENYVEVTPEPPSGFSAGFSDGFGS